CCASARTVNTKSERPSTIEKTFLFIASTHDSRLSPYVSFDHLVRSRQHIRWYRQADLLRRIEIDDQFKLHWLLDRHVGRFCAFKDLVHVGSSALITLRIVGRIGHKAASLY